MVGHFFATVNAVACGLQLFVLPRLISQRNLPLLLSSIPLLVFLFILIAYLQSSSSLTIMLAFGALKVLEYSVMTSAVEMMYMPFNEDVRYLGKELVKFFGGKLGKSGSSLTLSALNAHFQPGLSMQSFWSGILAIAWFGTMSSLSKYLISSRHPGAHKKDDDAGFLTSPTIATTAADDGEEEEIISTTTSESNLSNLSNSHFNKNVFNDDELERIFEEDPLADISPPDAWAQLTMPLTTATISSSNDLNNLFLKRSVSFQPEPTIIPPSTSQANLSDVSELSFHQSETASSSFLQQPNYMLRIGSTHVSLDELGDDEEDEEEEVDNNEPSKQGDYHPIPPRIFRSSGFYW